jgi:phage terminase large subunit
MQSTLKTSLSPSERLTELLAQSWDDCDIFNSGILGRLPFWSGQRRIAESVARYRITVCYTGNSVGKDYLLGSLVPWWLFTRKDSQVIITGPSQTVLGSVTFKEIRKAVEHSKIPLHMKVSQGIHGSPLRASVNGDWGALGYSTTSVERASGQHNRKLLVIGEEASGIPDEIYDAIDGLKFTRLLLIGNPIRSLGRFVDLIHQAAKDARDRVPPGRAVNAIRISSRESPHAHLEESPFGMADKTFIEDCERRHGRTSLWVRVHIDAEIPSVDAESLIPVAWLDWAAVQKRKVYPPGHPSHATRRIACDLGEGVGRDSSAILVRDDLGILEVRFGSQLGLPEAAGIIWELRTKWDIPDERISYDRVGIGREFHLHLARRGISKAVGYAGAGSPRSADFVNLRTEAAWMLRNRLNVEHIPDHRFPDSHQPAFCIPPGDYWARMRDELKALTYSIVGHKTALMTKEDHAILLGHSPDICDAFCQSWAFS